MYLLVSKKFGISLAELAPPAPVVGRAMWAVCDRIDRPRGRSINLSPVCELSPCYLNHSTLLYDVHAEQTHEEALAANAYSRIGEPVESGRLVSIQQNSNYFEVQN